MVHYDSVYAGLSNLPAGGVALDGSCAKVTGRVIDTTQRFAHHAAAVSPSSRTTTSGIMKASWDSRIPGCFTDVTEHLYTP